MLLGFENYKKNIHCPSLIKILLSLFFAEMLVSAQFGFKKNGLV